MKFAIVLGFFPIDIEGFFSRGGIRSRGEPMVTGVKSDFQKGERSPRDEA